MNAIPLLGIQHSDGCLILPLKVNPTDPPESATSRVNFIMPTALPSHKDHVVRAKFTSPDVPLLDGEFLFEPNQKTLGDRSLTALESVVTARGGEVFLLIENYSGITRHINTGEELATLRFIPQDHTTSSDAIQSANLAIKTIVSSPEAAGCSSTPV